jgi:hypothetical protein
MWLSVGQIQYQADAGFSWGDLPFSFCEMIFYGQSMFIFSHLKPSSNIFSILYWVFFHCQNKSFK